MVRRRARRADARRRSRRPRRATWSCCPAARAGSARSSARSSAPASPLLMESPTYWGAILAAAQAGVRRRARCRAGPTGPIPTTLARAFERDRGARLLRPADLRQPHRGAVVARAARSSVLDVVREHGAFLIEDDWAHDFGIDDDAAPARRARRRRPRRLPALADEERLAVAARRRGDRPRAGPRAHPRRPRRRVDVRQRPAAGRGARRRHPAGLAHPPARACASSCAPAATSSSAASPSTSPTRTSTHVPARGAEPLGYACPTARTSSGSSATARATACWSLRATEWFPAEPTGPYLRLNYSGPGPNAFPKAATVIGRHLTSH